MFFFYKNNITVGASLVVFPVKKSYCQLEQQEVCQVYSSQSVACIGNGENCLSNLRGQYQGHTKNATIILETAASMIL